MTEKFEQSMNEQKGIYFHMQKCAKKNPVEQSQMIVMFFFTLLVIPTSLVSALPLIIL